MLQDKTALSIPAQTEQEITLEALHVQFQQLCFAYGSLAVTTFNTEKFKWLAQDAVALSEVAMDIHRQNNAGDI